MDSKKEKKKECPSCAMMVDAKAEVCPICGYEFPKSSFVFKLLVIILLVAVILYFVI